MFGTTCDCRQPLRVLKIKPHRQGGNYCIHKIAMLNLNKGAPKSMAFDRKLYVIQCQEGHTAVMRQERLTWESTLYEILDVAPGMGKVSLKQKCITIYKCTLRIHLSYFIFIPWRSSFLIYASSTYTRSCEIQPLYEIRSPHIFTTRNNPT